MDVRSKVSWPHWQSKSLKFALVSIDTFLHYHSMVLGSPVIARKDKGLPIASCRMLDKPMRGAQLQNALQMVPMLRGEDFIKDGARAGITLQAVLACCRLAKSPHEDPRLEITSERQ